MQRVPRIMTFNGIVTKNEQRSQRTNQGINLIDNVGIVKGQAWCAQLSCLSFAFTFCLLHKYWKAKNTRHTQVQPLHWCTLLQFVSTASTMQHLDNRKVYGIQRWFKISFKYLPCSIRAIRTQISCSTWEIKTWKHRNM